MGPAFGPVGDDGGDAHHFAEDKEPEDMFGGETWRKAGAYPGAQNRDHNEERGADKQRRVGGDATFFEVAGEDATQQGVGAEDEDDGKDVASEHDSDGL